MITSIARDDLLHIEPYFDGRFIDDAVEHIEADIFQKKRCIGCIVLVLYRIDWNVDFLLHTNVKINGRMMTASVTGSGDNTVPGCESDYLSQAMCGRLLVSPHMYVLALFAKGTPT
jgi:hypothetical protein